MHIAWSVRAATATGQACVILSPTACPGVMPVAPRPKPATIVGVSHGGCPRKRSSVSMMDGRCKKSSFAAGFAATAFAVVRFRQRARHELTVEP